MKKVIYITGNYHSGKSQSAMRLGTNFGIPVYEADIVYVDLIKKYNRHFQYPESQTAESKQDIKLGYAKLLKDAPEFFIINGVNLIYEFDRKAIEEAIGEHEKIFLMIMPKYEHWCKIFDDAVKDQGEVILSDKNMKFYGNMIARFEEPDYHYYIVEDYRDLIVSGLGYQVEALARKKFNGLELPDLKDARVLDLGCAEGWMGKYCLEKGAKEVVGVDNNWWFLEQAKKNGLKVVLGDLDKIHLTDYGKFDYVLCLSVIHRVINKEHLLEQISLVTKKEALFEFPITQRDGKIMERYDSMRGHNPRETRIWCMSRDLIEDWFGKYFSHYVICGKSPLSYGDASYRIVIKGGKKC